jgi:hypothetical protein
MQYHVAKQVQTSVHRMCAWLFKEDNLPQPNVMNYVQVIKHLYLRHTSQMKGLRSESPQKPQMTHVHQLLISNFKAAMHSKTTAGSAGLAWRSTQA